MRKASVYQQGKLAGALIETNTSHYQFIYAPKYVGEPVSLSMPVRLEPYEFDRMPPVFEGLLPEGLQLDALLRTFKVDGNDLFTQLLLVGGNVVGSLQVKEA